MGRLNGVCTLLHTPSASFQFNPSSLSTSGARKNFRCTKNVKMLILSVCPAPLRALRVKNIEVGELLPEASLKPPEARENKVASRP